MLVYQFAELKVGRRVRSPGALTGGDAFTNERYELWRWGGGGYEAVAAPARAGGLVDVYELCMYEFGA
jgi:hypothetical protein